MLSFPRWPLFTAALAVFLIAKLLYVHASTADVRFLLAPTNALVSLLLNSASEFEPARGYVHAGLRIVIDKSCAGGNFWLLSWLLFTFDYLHQSIRPPRAAVLLALPAASLGLTVLVNTARIVGAVAVAQAWPFGAPPAWLHEAQGALVYLFFLVVSHFGFLFLLSNSSSSRAHVA